MSRYIPYQILEDFEKNIKKKLEETKKNKPYEKTFFKRVKEYNTLMKIDNYKFKEYKSYIKNKEITVKILNKDEIKKKKKKFVKDMTLLFNYNFPKDIWILRGGKVSYKKYLTIFKVFIDFFSDSKLFLLKDYENEIQEKTNLTNKESTLFDTPRMIEGYIDLSKLLTRMIENDELSDKEKNKIAYILMECIIDMSLIKIDKFYIVLGNYTEDAKRMETLINEGESIIDKYTNLINKYIKLSLNEQENLKKSLEILEICYVLF
jgi:hypothetical protein